MRLVELIKDVKIKNKINFDKDIEVSGLSIDSRKTEDNDVFIAIKGFNKDGHDFAIDATRSGAKVIFTQKPLELPPDITQIVVTDCREQLPVLCKNFYKDPTKDILLTGVTGTNGKTTTVYLIDSIFKNSGYRTSYITTVGARIDNHKLSFERTTPEIIDLNNFFYLCLNNRVRESCMEVSSHSIDLHRVEHLDFDYLVFTNLTQDHLDYHGSMDNYFKAKERLFLKNNRKLYGGKMAVINIDDIYGIKITAVTDLETLTFGINNKDSDIIAKNIKNSINGIEMDVFIKSTNKTFKVKSELCGFFNVYNILAATSVCIAEKIDVNKIKVGLRLMKGVPGRFEKIGIKNKKFVIVDYAHTPDGLKNVLITAKSLLPAGGRLITVFGCGGDRDKKKRKIMGRISAGISDFTIITSDNPRSENPVDIIKMIQEGLIESGCNAYKIEENRRKAIYNALDFSHKGDIILIAGKGHEDYQEFKDKKIHFSDQEVIREWNIK